MSHKLTASGKNIVSKGVKQKNAFLNIKATLKHKNIKAGYVSCLNQTV